MTTKGRKYPKAPCPDCGVLVVDTPGWWRKHAEKCVVQHQTAGTLTEGELARIKDPELAEIAKQALLAQDKMSSAPEAFVASAHSDPMMERRRVYLPESIGREPTMHAYFGLHNRRRLDAQAGYIPVIDEHGQQVTFQELDMWKIPQWQHKMREKASQDRAASMAPKTTAELLEARGGSDEASALSDPGIKVESSVTESKGTVADLIEQPS